MSGSEPFDEARALGVIQEMVQQSRYRLGRSAVYFMMWGGCIIAACLLHYSFIQLQDGRGVYVWPVFITLGVIGSLLIGWRQARTEQRHSRSYIDRINTYIWAGSSLPFAILVGVGSVYGWAAAYPAFIAFFGWGALVTGGLLRFRPLIAGGIASWGIAGFTLFVNGPEILLLLAAALLLSYVIPAFLMWRADTAAAVQKS